MDDFDGADLVASFANDCYAVTRAAAGTWTAGRPVAGATTTFEILAFVVPAKGRDLLRLPEGRRAVASLLVFTSTPLFVGGEGEAHAADLVTIDGRAWEVEHVERWPGSTDFYKAIVQAVQA